MSDDIHEAARALAAAQMARLTPVLGLLGIAVSAAWGYYARRRRREQTAERRRAWRTPLAPGEIRGDGRGRINIGPPDREQLHAHREEAVAQARAALERKPGTRNETIARRYGLTKADVRRIRREAGIPYRTRQFGGGNTQRFGAAVCRAEAEEAGPS